MNSEPGQGSDCNCYLTEVSPRDKPWDVNKVLAQKLKHLYQGTVNDKLAGRIAYCSGCLEFGWVSDPETGEIRLKLKSCRFCRVRHCPICQWRRSLMWVARFLKVLPSITRDYPTARYIFLTLTVKNCELSELRSTLTWMNEAWKRLTHRKQWPGIGFARSTEVTRSKDGTAHPHFHTLVMVPSGYFKSGNYLSQADWTELWRSCLQVEYTPIVDVRAVRANKKRQRPDGELTHIQEVLAAIVETFKYTVKPEDLIGQGTEDDQRWLLELTQQLHKTRAIALGGVLRNYLSESEPEDLVGENDDGELLEDASLWFGWREMAQRYIKIDGADQYSDAPNYKPADSLH